MPTNVEDTSVDRTTVSDIEKMLNDDTTDEQEVLEIPGKLETKPESVIPEEKDKTAEKSDEEKEIELELDELDADDPEKLLAKEEELQFAEVPRRKDILKKYPEVFKDFPFLERAMYKVSKIDDLFPTLNDASLAVEKSQALDRFEHEIMTGNIDNIFSEVKRLNGNSFNKLVDNLFPALYKVDPNATTHLQKAVIAKLVQGMLEDGREQNNETITNAANIVKQLIFGNGKVEISKLAQEEKPNAEQEKLNAERRQFATQKFHDTAGGLANKIESRLVNTIESHIDPKGSMSGYVKTKASADALEFVNAAIRNDSSFRNAVNRCWDNIWRNNYSPESLAKLESVYYAKAKTVIGPAIMRARREALKDASSNSRGSKNEERPPIRPGRVAPQQTTKTERPGKKMSTLDFFMKD